MQLRSPLFVGMSKKKENACYPFCWPVRPDLKVGKGLDDMVQLGFYCFLIEILVPIPLNESVLTPWTDNPKQEMKGEMWNANDSLLFGPVSTGHPPQMTWRERLILESEDLGSNYDPGT